MSIQELPAWVSARAPPTELDPGEWRPWQRCGHVAAGITASEMLIYTGYMDDGDYLETSHIWCYNVDWDSWTRYKFSGPYPQSVSGASSQVVGPHWYILGGHSYEGHTNEMSRLHIPSLTWEVNMHKNRSNSEMMSPRDKFSTWEFENKIFVLGGWGPNPKNGYLWDRQEDIYTPERGDFMGWNDQLLSFDTETLTWENVGPITKGPRPRGRAACAAARHGKQVYIFGGRHREKRMNDLHCFTHNTGEGGTWSGTMAPEGKPPCGRSWHSLTLSGPGTLLLYGGFSQDRKPLDDAWVLHVGTLTWCQLSRSTGRPRLWHTAVATPHHDVLLYGGCNNDILSGSGNVTTSKIIMLLRSEPFTLERMCLHVVFKNIKTLRLSLSDLPKVFRNWLIKKERASDHVKTLKKESDFLSYPNIQSILGPSLEQLTFETVFDKELNDQLEEIIDEL